MIVRKDGEALDVAEHEVEKFEKLGWAKAEETELAKGEFVIPDNPDVSKKK
jgi:hypothetical protein